MTTKEIIQAVVELVRAKVINTGDYSIFSADIFAAEFRSASVFLPRQSGKSDAIGELFDVTKKDQVVVLNTYFASKMVARGVPPENIFLENLYRPFVQGSKPNITKDSTIWFDIDGAFDIDKALNKSIFVQSVIDNLYRQNLPPLSNFPVLVYVGT